MIARRFVTGRLNAFKDASSKKAGVKITQKQVEVVERLTDLSLRVVLFWFILAGVAVLTAFFVYCSMNDKGWEAQAISGFGELVFFSAFGRLVWKFFTTDNPRDS